MRNLFPRHTLTNVGPLDQWLRLSLGFLLLFAASTGIVGAWGWIGVVPLLTAMFSYCPLYHAVGLSTAKAKSRS